MRLSDSSLRGLTVLGANGQVIGSIAGMFVDSATWRIETLQVKLRTDVADQLGASHDIFHSASIEVPVRLVQSVGDAVILSVSAQGLREVLPDGNVSSSAAD